MTRRRRARELDAGSRDSLALNDAKFVNNKTGGHFWKSARPRILLLIRLFDNFRRRIFLRKVSVQNAQNGFGHRRIAGQTIVFGARIRRAVENHI